MNSCFAVFSSVSLPNAEVSYRPLRKYTVSVVCPHNEETKIWLNRLTFTFNYSIIIFFKSGKAKRDARLHHYSWKCSGSRSTRKEIFPALIVVSSSSPLSHHCKERPPCYCIRIWEVWNARRAEAQLQLKKSWVRPVGERFKQNKSSMSTFLLGTWGKNVLLLLWHPE